MKNAKRMKLARNGKGPESPVEDSAVLGHPGPLIGLEERTWGPDGLAHYDCPMERGQEPCRCGARALWGEHGSALEGDHGA